MPVLDMEGVCGAGEAEWVPVAAEDGVDAMLVEGVRVEADEGRERAGVGVAGSGEREGEGLRLRFREDLAAARGGDGGGDGEGDAGGESNKESEYKATADARAALAASAAALAASFEWCRHGRRRQHHQCFDPVNLSDHLAISRPSFPP